MIDESSIRIDGQDPFANISDDTRDEAERLVDTGVHSYNSAYRKLGVLPVAQGSKELLREQKTEFFSPPLFEDTMVAMSPVDKAAQHLTNVNGIEAAREAIRKAIETKE